MPKVFILENVKGFKSVHNGAAYDEFVNRLQRIRNYETGAIAYSVTPMLLNALDYGSPPKPFAILLRWYKAGSHVELRPRDQGSPACQRNLC